MRALFRRRRIRPRRTLLCSEWEEVGHTQTKNRQTARMVRQLSFLRKQESRPVPASNIFTETEGSGSRIKCGMTEIIHNGQLNDRKAKKQVLILTSSPSTTQLTSLAHARHDNCWEGNDLLVPLDSTPYGAYICGLSS